MSNADREKPIDINGKVVRFEAFDEEKDSCYNTMQLY